MNGNSGLRTWMLGMVIGLSLAAGLIISAAQFTRAWLHIAESQVISVTGSARRDVTSDLAIWSAGFTAEGENLSVAHKKLKADGVRVLAYLAQRNVPEPRLSAISIRHIKAPTKSQFEGQDNQKTVGYSLSQEFRVESTNVQLVVTTQEQSTSLVEAGVELDDRGLQFIYTRIAESKIELLAEATKDARQRAEQIAGQGGRKVKGLRSARMGVFQITSPYSGESSAEGFNDTLSREKHIRAVVSATFTME